MAIPKPLDESSIVKICSCGLKIIADDTGKKWIALDGAVATCYIGLLYSDAKEWGCDGQEGCINKECGG